MEWSAQTTTELDRAERWMTTESLEEVNKRSEGVCRECHIVLLG